jgi:hypothetical protein
VAREVVHLAVQAGVKPLAQPLWCVAEVEPGEATSGKAVFDRVLADSRPQCLRI